MIKTIEKANYRKAENRARELLKESGINIFPVDLFSLIDWYNQTHSLEIAVKPFSWYIKRYRVSLDFVKKYARSNDGCSHYIKESQQVIIFYNDFIRHTSRIRWTIAHELGHLLLGHLDDDKALLFMSNFTRSEYNKYELEANVFARELLAPMSLVYYLYKIFGKSVAIDRAFYISHEATDKIVKRMISWAKKGHNFDREKCLYFQFDKFIHSRYCKVCHNFFIVSDENIKYCHICGNKLDFGYGGLIKQMKYENYETNENHQVIKCIRCGNEDIDYENKRYAYCHICGAPVINRCLGVYEGADCCPEPMPANARYCPYCGGTTTFREEGILGTWEEEQAKLDELFS